MAFPDDTSYIAGEGLSWGGDLAGFTGDKRIMLGNDQVDSYPLDLNWSDSQPAGYTPGPPSTDPLSPRYDSSSNASSINNINRSSRPPVFGFTPTLTANNQVDRSTSAVSPRSTSINAYSPFYNSRYNTYTYTSVISSTNSSSGSASDSAMPTQSSASSVATLPNMATNHVPMPIQLILPDDTSGGTIEEPDDIFQDINYVPLEQDETAEGLSLASYEQGAAVIFGVAPVSSDQSSQPQAQSGDTGALGVRDARTLQLISTNDLDNLSRVVGDTGLITGHDYSVGGFDQIGRSNRGGPIGPIGGANPYGGTEAKDAPVLYVNPGLLQSVPRSSSQSLRDVTHNVNTTSQVPLQEASQNHTTPSFYPFSTTTPPDPAEFARTAHHGGSLSSSAMSFASPTTAGFNTLRPGFTSRVARSSARYASHPYDDGSRYSRQYSKGLDDAEAPGMVALTNSAIQPMTHVRLWNTSYMVTPFPNSTPMKPYEFTGMPGRHNDQGSTTTPRPLDKTLLDDAMTGEEIGDPNYPLSSDPGVRFVLASSWPSGRMTNEPQALVTPSLSYPAPLPNRGTYPPVAPRMRTVEALDPRPTTPTPPFPFPFGLDKAPLPSGSQRFDRSLYRDIASEDIEDKMDSEGISEEITADDSVPKGKQKRSTEAIGTSAERVKANRFGAQLGWRTGHGTTLRDFVGKKGVLKITPDISHHWAVNFVLEHARFPTARARTPIELALIQFAPQLTFWLKYAMAIEKSSRPTQMDIEVAYHLVACPLIAEAREHSPQARRKSGRNAKKKSAKEAEHLERVRCLAMAYPRASAMWKRVIERYLKGNHTARARDLETLSEALFGEAWLDQLRLGAKENPFEAHLFPPVIPFPVDYQLWVDEAQADELILLALLRVKHYHESQGLLPRSFFGEFTCDCCVPIAQ